MNSLALWACRCSTATARAAAWLRSCLPAGLHHSLRALPRPLLESLTRAFRKRFQVPEAAATIADRINQRCHHDWIEAFLVQHQLQPGRAAQPPS